MSFQFSSDCIVVLHTFLDDMKASFGKHINENKKGPVDDNEAPSIIIVQLPQLELQILRQHNQSMRLNCINMSFALGDLSLAEIGLLDSSFASDYSGSLSTYQMIRLTIEQMELYEMISSEQVQVMSIVEDESGTGIRFCTTYHRTTFYTICQIARNHRMFSC